MNENKKITTAEELLTDVASKTTPTTVITIPVKDQKAADFELMQTTKAADWETFCVNYAAIGYSLPLSKKLLKAANVAKYYIDSIQEFGETLQVCYFEYYGYKKLSNADPEQIKIKRDICFDYVKRIIQFFNLSRKNYKMTPDFIDELGGKLYTFTYFDKENIHSGQTMKPVNGFKAVDMVLKLLLIANIDRRELAANVATKVMERKQREEKKEGVCKRINLPILQIVETAIETEKTDETAE